MARTRKYRKGEPIRDVLELVRLILSGVYVFQYDRPTHPSWLGSRQLLDLKMSTARGAFHRAELNLPIEEKTE